MINLGKKTILPPGYLESKHLVKRDYALTATTEDQTVFNLPSGVSYEVGQNQLEVHPGGIKNGVGNGFVETSSTSFTLDEGVSVGTVVLVTIWFYRSPASAFVSPNEFTSYQTETDSKIGILQRLGVTTASYPKLSGESDDTLRIKRAIDYAKSVGFRTVYLTEQIEISDTIYLQKEGDRLGIRFEAIAKEGMDVVTNLTGTKPAFAIERATNNVEGWNERYSNAGLSRIRIRPKVVSPTRTGTAIYLRGAINTRYEDIHISNMKYGIWLHNEGTGIYTEHNTFRDCWVDFCENGIRMERGTGDESFHGNVFDNVRMNVKPNHTGLNLHSGYWYNGTFNLIMWTQKNDDGTQPTGTNRPTLINVGATGKGKNNVGHLRVEAYSEGRLTGTGYFWFRGHIHGIGGAGQPNVYIDDTVLRSDGKRVFQFDNRLSPIESKTLSANAGVTQTSTFTGTKNATAPYIATIRVYGTGFEYRKTMFCWTNGDGTTNGIYQDFGTWQDTTKTGVTVTSRWVDANGNFGINIQTDIPLTLEYRAFGLNNIPDNSLANMPIS